MNNDSAHSFAGQDAGCPVIILGGQQNALSLTRSLGRSGIVVIVSSTIRCIAALSRYCSQNYPVPSGTLPEDYWKEILLDSPPGAIVPGTLIISCSDEAVQFVAEHVEDLKATYKLEINEAAMQLAMLDKQETIRIAREANVPAPGFVPLNSIDDIDIALQNIAFPALLKPLQTHVFRRVFGDKMVLCQDAEQLLDVARKALEANVPCMVTEFIPGGDDKLSGYHTFIDSNGERRFEFTKRLFRRYPEYFGMGVNHVTTELPDVVEIGRRFFAATSYRGIGNIEFKFDDRDNQWKIIECNPRFTAIQELILKSGLDTGSLVYGEATGDRIEMPSRFKLGLSFIHIEKDFRAYLALRKAGRLTFFEWLASVPLSYVRPYFSWTDPMPFLARFRSLCRKVLRKVLSKLGLK